MVSSANFLRVHLIPSPKSSIKILNRTGHSTEPWGTPQLVTGHEHFNSIHHHIFCNILPTPESFLTQLCSFSLESLIHFGWIKEYILRTGCLCSLQLMYLKACISHLSHFFFFQMPCFLKILLVGDNFPTPDHSCCSPLNFSPLYFLSWRNSTLGEATKLKGTCSLVHFPRQCYVNNIHTVCDYFPSTSCKIPHGRSITN